MIKELPKSLPEKGEQHEIEHIRRMASEAVADAMTVAYAEAFLRISEKLQSALKHLPSVSRIDTMLEKATSSLCKQNSTKALAYLWDKYQEYFETGFLLQSTNKMETDAKDFEGFKQNPGWDYHVYFLARDKTGFWYAGSPANHAPNTTSDNLYEIFKSENLEEVLESIGQKEGSFWPTAQYIKSLLEITNTPRMKDVNWKGFDKGIKKFSFMFIKRDSPYRKERSTRDEYWVQGLIK